MEDVAQVEVQSDLDNGTAVFDGEGVSLLHDATYAVLQQNLESRIPGLGHRTMYLAGEAGSKRSIDASLTFLLSSVGRAFGRQLIEQLAERANRRGLGHLTIDAGFNYNTGEGPVRLTNSFIARHYPRTQTGVQCYSWAGFLSGAVQIIYGGNFFIQELECVAQGRPACRFASRAVSDAERLTAIRNIH